MTGWGVTVPCTSHGRTASCAAKGGDGQFVIADPDTDGLGVWSDRSPMEWLVVVDVTEDVCQGGLLVRARPTVLLGEARFYRDLRLMMVSRCCVVLV